MRSELIGEIFSVEEEAERLISGAREKGRSLLIERQQSKEQELHEAVRTARAEREATIASEQKAASARIEAARKSLAESESEDQQIQECAAMIADRMVNVLCMTRLGDSRP